MAQILWGEGKPQFFVKGVWVTLPFPRTYDYRFIPDIIAHTRIDGTRYVIHRGYYFEFRLVYELIEKTQAIWIRDIIDFAKSKGGTLFRPHQDFPLTFFVTVNEEEGWNFELFQGKQIHGYSGEIICRSTSRIESLPAQEQILSTIYGAAVI
jgi:hypothetical protein